MRAAVPPDGAYTRVRGNVGGGQRKGTHCQQLVFSDARRWGCAQVHWAETKLNLHVWDGTHNLHFKKDFPSRSIHSIKLEKLCLKGIVAKSTKKTAGEGNAARPSSLFPPLLSLISLYLQPMRSLPSIPLSRTWVRICTPAFIFYLLFKRLQSNFFLHVPYTNYYFCALGGGYRQGLGLYHVSILHNFVVKKWVFLFSATKLDLKRVIKPGTRNPGFVSFASVRKHGLEAEHCAWCQDLPFVSSSADNHICKLQQVTWPPNLSPCRQG